MAKRVTARINDAGGSYFASPRDKMRFISSGCTTLNLALGGGWAEGKIANIVGDKSTGKTLLCIEACANFLLKYPKGKIRYRETEAAFDQDYAKALGMPVDKIDFGSDKLETVEDLFEDLLAIAKKAKAPELYICDSLDALSDREEMERDMDKGSYGTAKAKALSQMFRRLIRLLEEKQITVMIVSQVRSKIGLTFGRTTTRSGGRALDFYATHVVFLAHTGQITTKIGAMKRATGVTVLAKIDKNKVSQPFRETSFPILFGYGVDDVTACVDFLEEAGALGMIGESKATKKDYIKWLKKMPRSEFVEEMRTLSKKVSRKWYEIEEALLPKQTKYGI